MLRRSVFRKSARRPAQDHYPECENLDRKRRDFAKFAARILLSYIYEEVLGWDIAENSIEELKVFMQPDSSSISKKASKLRD